MSNVKNINVTKLLGYQLKQTQHSLRLRMDEALKILELTTPQYAVLAQLEYRPGISNASLARYSFITAQTMHGIVVNLEKRYLIKRKIIFAHGRILSNELTEDGIKIVQQAHRIIGKVEAKMNSTICEADMKLLKKLLNECFNNLNINVKE